VLTVKEGGLLEPKKKAPYQRKVPDSGGSWGQSIGASGPADGNLGQKCLRKAGGLWVKCFFFEGLDS
jgi:hypothetical protein